MPTFESLAALGEPPVMERALISKEQLRELGAKSYDGTLLHLPEQEFTDRELFQFLDDME